MLVEKSKKYYLMLSLTQKKKKRTHKVIEIKYYSMSGDTPPAHELQPHQALY